MQPDRTAPAASRSVFDARVRVSEIRQENHGGDVSWVDIDWLCDVALKAADVAELRHYGMRHTFNASEAIPKSKLVGLRSVLGMPRG